MATAVLSPCSDMPPSPPTTGRRPLPPPAPRGHGPRPRAPTPKASAHPLPTRTSSRHRCPPPAAQSRTGAPCRSCSMKWELATRARCSALAPPPSPP
uniref:Uncharacterized protein n=1 Tax=Arundo donax TaxID=35708 RepID=A0A0A9A961_ARUDO